MDDNSPTHCVSCGAIVFRSWERCIQCGQPIYDPTANTSDLPDFFKTLFGEDLQKLKKEK